MRTTIKVRGMHCQNCVNAVIEALKRVPGVSKVEVTLENALATVDYEGTDKTVEEMLEAIDDIGFEGERA